ncbi:hypothetical protein MUK42_31246 [Musa troglodytarum]|uniref:Uncharacterized protein n=1 Tax=Musa troglodytarum TaxID=320322 RepID=A0A9E7FLU2_9LILI|nr:hypothetical protein MUK42_31246 [Musa troglodytarum]
MRRALPMEELRAGIRAGRRRSSRSTWKAEDCKFRALVVVSPPPFCRASHQAFSTVGMAAYRPRRPFPSPPRYKWGKPGASHSQPSGEEKERERERERQTHAEMGGGQSSSRSSSCFFFRSQRRDDEADGEPKYTSSKVRPSDEDRGRWVGEPDVDVKASAFIAKFHETRFMDLERQTMVV